MLTRRVEVPSNLQVLRACVRDRVGRVGRGYDMRRGCGWNDRPVVRDRFRVPDAEPCVFCVERAKGCVLA